jgi:hypothetical protein
MFLMALRDNAAEALSTIVARQKVGTSRSPI